MNSAKYITLRGKLGASGTLTCTYGSTTAVLTKCSRVEMAGFDAAHMSADEYSVACDIVFLNTTDGVWS